MKNTSNITPKVQDSEVIIRPWCRDDQSGVWNVLKDGSFSQVPISFLLLLRKKRTHAFVLIIGSFVLGYWGYFIVALLTVAVTLCCIYFGVWLAALFYLYGPPLWDMKNVEENYFTDENSKFWVAEVNGQIAGTIAIVRQIPGNKGHQNKKSSADIQGGKVAWLRRMAVLRQFRGNGVAKALVETAVTFCKSRQYDKIELITTEVHHAARKLYENCGFKCMAYQPHKYFKGLVHIWTYEYEMKLKE